MTSRYSDASVGVSHPFRVFRNRISMNYIKNDIVLKGIGRNDSIERAFLFIYISPLARSISQ